jgi:hypothetical protein
MQPRLREKLMLQIAREMFILPRKETRYNSEITITKKLSTQVCSELLSLKIRKSSQVSKTKTKIYQIN